MEGHTKEQAMKIMGIPQKHAALLTHEETPSGLVLLHFVEPDDTNDSKFRAVSAYRGPIVDIKTGAKIATSIGFTENIDITDPIMNYDDRFYYSPSENEQPKSISALSQLKVSETNVYFGFEGVFVRIFKHAGKAYFSIAAKIDGTKSSWGSSESFFTAWKRLGGQEPDTFFGEEDYSPYCYKFLLVSKCTFEASSTRSEEIYFLGCEQMWDIKTYAAKNGPYYSACGFKKTTIKYRPMPSISLDTANAFLYPDYFAEKFENDVSYPEMGEMYIDYSQGEPRVQFCPVITGGYVDPRLCGGDPIILVSRGVVYRLIPESYKFRSSITQGNANMYHQFLLGLSKMVWMPKEDVEKQYPPMKNPRAEGLCHESSKILDRQLYWWTLFYKAVHPIHKGMLLEFLPLYFEDVERLVSVIRNWKIYMNSEDREVRKLFTKVDRERMMKIVDAAHDYANDKGKDIGEVARYRLYKETGPCIYRLINIGRKIVRVLPLPELVPL